MNAQEARDTQFKSRIILIDREIDVAASMGNGMVLLNCVRSLTEFERKRLIDGGFDVSERCENFGSVIVRWHEKPDPKGAFGPIAPEDEAAFSTETKAEARPGQILVWRDGERVWEDDPAAEEALAAEKQIEQQLKEG